MKLSLPWSSLELAKLLVSALTPLAVALLGIYLTRIAKRFEHLQWRNQRLIEKRIAVYDGLAPQLNDLLCYFCFVGCWKDLTPPQVVGMKREIDKKIYLAAPLFSAAFHFACMRFMNLCFETFQGWGLDAKLRTPPDRRVQAAGPRWDPGWADCFADHCTDVSELRAAYRDIMTIFSVEIGINPDAMVQPLGRYPTNVKATSVNPTSMNSQNRETEVTTLTVLVEQVRGELTLRIPLTAGGDRFLDCTRGIGKVVGGNLVVVLPTSLTQKLSLDNGREVVINNRDGEFHIMPVMHSAKPPAN